MLVLPDFEILKKQPKVPHVARVVASRNIPNEYGVPTTYTVRESRNHREWWISAGRQGMRASNTLHTSTRARADAWIRAVETGEIEVEDKLAKRTPAELDRDIEETLAKIREKHRLRGWK